MQEHRTRRARRSLTGALVAALCAAACGTSSTEVTPKDAGSDGFVVHPRKDAAVPIDEAPDAANAPWDRMTMHDGVVLGNAKLQAVYIGEAGVDSAQSFDDLMSWMVTSAYWKVLDQYGVHDATMLPSVHLATREVLPEGSVTKGLIDVQELERRLGALMRASVDATDGGDASDTSDTVDAGDAEAADADPGDAQVPDAARPLLPKADAYVFFLPNGVNVSLPNETAHPWETCIDVGGYHSFAGAPYSVLPPCAVGRSALSISHEITEMVTDPHPPSGWFSDDDVTPAGGEIGDLCNEATSVEGWAVTRLWSNADGDCVPSR